MDRRLIKFGVIYAASSSLQKGIGFFVFMFLANQLSTEQYAAFGLNYSLFTIMMAFSVIGIYQTIVGVFSGYSTEQKNGLLRAGNTVFLFLSVITFFLGLCVIPFLDNQFNSIYEYVFFSFSASVLGYFTYQSSLVRLNEEHFTSIVFSFVPYVLSYVLGFSLVVFYVKEQNFYFLGVFISVMISIILLFPLLKNKIYLSTNKQDVFVILRNITPYIILGVLSWLSGYGNSYVVNYFFEDIDVATFVFLFTLSSVLQLLGSSLNQVWAPRFYNDYAKYSVFHLEKKYAKFNLLQSLVLASAAVFIILAANIGFQFFEGWKKFQNRELEMYLLFLGYIVSISWWHHQNYFMINNKGKALMSIVSISSLLGYIAWVLCMFLLGRIGIYVGYLIHISIRSLFVFFKARKFWAVKSDWQAIALGGLIMSIALLFS